MKKNIVFFLAVCGLIILSSCEKDNGSGPATPAFMNSPTCAYSSYEPVAGGGWGQFISFFDLRSSNVAEKKYFKVQLKYVGATDSFEMVTPPQSINNLAPGFPAEIIKYPGFGGVNQWTNPQYRLLSNAGGAYYKDSIVTNPASNIYYLHQNFLSGPLQGEWPQSNLDYVRVPVGTNGQTQLHSRTIFYFKKGLCLDTESSATTVKSIASFYNAAPVYDWQNIDAAIQITPGEPGVYNLYFLDFKNWRFFKWQQYMNNIFSPAQLATTFGDYQSLDKLIQWPEGWGRP